MGDANNNPKPSARPQVQYICGKGYAIVDARGIAISGFEHDKERLRARLAKITAEADAKAKRGPRPCLCCGSSFASEGIHNRLCNSCRHRSGEAEGARPMIPRKHGRAA